MSIRVLFGDETNVTSNHGDFFIYGGLAATPESMIKVHHLVAEVRQKYGFKPTDPFKFSTNSRPKSVDFEDWTAAKKELLLRAAELDELDLITYVVLHELARNTSAKDKMRYALNVILAHFDLVYLKEKNAHGLVSIDRVDNLGFGYLAERFTKPLELPDDNSVMLKRTLLLSQTCDGASHMSSLVDIVLGAFRYCVNTATGAGQDAVAVAMFTPVASLLWEAPEQDSSGTRGGVDGYGFLKYPKSIKSQAYQGRYDNLTETLQAYAKADVPNAD